MSKCEWDEYGVLLCLLVADMADGQYRREMVLGRKAHRADENKVSRYDRYAGAVRSGGRGTYWRATYRSPASSP